MSTAKDAGECVNPFAEPDAVATLDALAQTNRFEALGRAADALMRRHPQDRRVVLRRALASAAAGRGAEAREAFMRARTLAPALASCHALVGAALTRLGVLQGAFAELKEALRLDPRSAPALSAMGSLQQRLGDDDIALQCFERAAALAPTSAEMQMLLALALQRAGRIAACQAAGRRAAALGGDSGAVVGAQAHLLAETGAVEEALTLLERRRRAAPDDTLINRQYAALRLQLRASAAASFQAAEREDAVWRDLEASAARTDDAGQMLRAAIAWVLQDRWSQARRVMATALAAAIPEQAAALRRADPKAAAFLLGYHGFITALLADQPGESVEEEALGAAPILHFGDSHCLTYAHRVVRLRDTAVMVRPRLCLGAKAHHLALKGPTQAKAVLQRLLETAPRDAAGSLDAAALWFSFGEIDCRQSEGILAHHRKSGAPLDRIVRDTVEGYVGWLAQALEEALDQPPGASPAPWPPVYLFGAPAPIRAAESSGADHAARLDVIRRFNQALSQAAEAAGFRMIDLWRVTIGPDGEAEAAAFCDGVHLRPATASAIEAQL
ncbi:MAG: hypothetical protein AAGM38_13165 [Pseudomonadota bacterium]